jgi:hypothetical protein
MGVPGNANTLLLKSAAAGGGAYQVSRSLRFSSPDSSYLNRTPASAGNRRTFTFSTWVKRSKLSSGFQQLICSYDGSTGSTYFSLVFTPSDTIRVEDISVIYRETAQVFRDASAWYCIQLAVDTTQATAGNRIKLYVNGSEVTTFATTNNPSQNTDFGINNTVAHAIGRSGAQSAYYQDGYLADVYLLDGIATDPSSFTTTDLTTGQLIPKAYTGSYGTNGFKLNFSDNSTTAALGTDTSGNGNTWTVNNLSVTAGSGNDSLVDTPTSYGTDTGAGGEVRGNYATLNPLNNPGGSTLSNGNLDCVTSSSLNGRVVGSIAVSSGKWYWEMLATNVATDLMVGISAASETTATTIPTSATTYLYYNYNGNKYNNGSNSAYGATYTTNDVIGVALDLDAGTIVFYKNGTSQGTAFSSLSGTFVPAFADGGTGTSGFTANFGQRAFAYTAPSGFKALVDTNLPTPVVAKGSSAMDVVLYTGTGSSRSITGLNFSPDLVWTKGRSNADNNSLYDVIRGTGKELISESTSAEGTYGNTLTSFDSTGFSLGSASWMNGSGKTYVGWTWDAGTSTVTNTAGSITSQVRANATAGFSVSTFTGATTGTIGHGLGVAPSMIIMKARTSNPGANDWFVYHKTLGNTKYLMLNSTAAEGTYTVWNNTSPTSTVFSIGSGIGTPDWVAYAFAPVDGYSSFGSYTGNGSADGPFVYTGHKPRWLMIKCSSIGDAYQHWHIFDTARSGYNVTSAVLQANTSTSEGSFAVIDLLSNGFKIKYTDSFFNQSGSTWIFASFAENPFQYARAR